MIDLPDTPGPASVTWRVLDFGATRVPPLGGPVQRVNRTGNRWGIDVELPPLSPLDTRRWQAALMQAAREGARWKIRQIELPVAPLAGVLVAGASQTGTTLNVGVAGALWAGGQFFSLHSAGQRYLHQLASAGSFSASGTAALPLVEPLRVIPADNDIVDFAPRIEGMLTEHPAIAIGKARLGQISFSIEEMG
jgi:hypothetical protein